MVKLGCAQICKIRTFSRLNHNMVVADDVVLPIAVRSTTLLFNYFVNMPLSCHLIIFRRGDDNETRQR